MMWIFPLFPNLSSRKQPMNAEKRRDLSGHTVFCDKIVTSHY
jgi:hypothetical protein